ncbi:MAG: hypothetical protein Q9173_000873 [Seirophora scorigena]
MALERPSIPDPRIGAAENPFLAWARNVEPILGGFLLADEIGLGKTISTLSYLVLYAIEHGWLTTPSLDTTVTHDKAAASSKLPRVNFGEAEPSLASTSAPLSTNLPADHDEDGEASDIVDEFTDSVHVTIHSFRRRRLRIFYTHHSRGFLPGDPTLVAEGGMDEEHCCWQSV